MVVAGDHANNDMAGDDDDSWKSMFEASGDFDEIDCQIEGLGRIDAVEQLYVAHISSYFANNYSGINCYCNRTKAAAPTVGQLF